MIRCLVFCMALAAASSASAQQKKADPPPKDPPKKAEAESWYYKLGRILGVDKVPVGLKGPTRASRGELWITAADHAEPKKLTEGSDFSSPVFQPGGKSLFALRAGSLVEVPVAGGAAVKRRDVPGVVKLVGFDGDDPDRVLALVQKTPETAGLVDVVLLSIQTGRLETLAAQRPADSAEVKSLTGWQRQYGDVYVMPQGNEVVVGGIEAVEIPVTRCGQATCGQPAYSPERKLVAYIRSGE